MPWLQCFLICKLNKSGYLCQILLVQLWSAWHFYTFFICIKLNWTILNFGKVRNLTRAQTGRASLAWHGFKFPSKSRLQLLLWNRIDLPPVGFGSIWSQSPFTVHTSDRLSRLCRPFGSPTIQIGLDSVHQLTNFPSEAFLWNASLFTVSLSSPSSAVAVTKKNSYTSTVP